MEQPSNETAISIENRRGKAATTIFDIVTKESYSYRDLMIACNKPLIFPHTPFIGEPFRYEFNRAISLVEHRMLNEDLIPEFDALVQAKTNYEMEQLEEAGLDGLTGLPNRRQFLSQADKVIAMVKEGDVFIIDIDHFKTINDGLNHQVGDEVIKLVATVLKATFPNALLGRYGGEEFVGIIAKNGDIKVKFGEAQAELANTLKEIVPDTLKAGTLSIGHVAFKNDQHRITENLLQQADIALYIAKRSGRNRIEEFATS